VHMLVRALRLVLSPFNRFVRLLPPSLQWPLWPPLAGALQFAAFIGSMGL